MRRITVRAVTVLVSALITVIAFAMTGTTPARAASFPSTTLGIWNGSPGSVPDSQHPDVLNDYFYTADPVTDVSSFLSQAHGEGATPFAEIEPWNGNGGDCSDWAHFAANDSTAQSYESGLGSEIASYGHAVIVTFAHEFNIGGQYPWANGDSCNTSPATWVTAWKNFVTNVRAKANGNAFMLWGANVDPNGNDTVAAHYWPGAFYVDMAGVDGYEEFCGCGSTFADIFGGTFSEIKGLPGFSSVPQQKIFIAETSMSPYDAGGISSFVSDLCAGGGDGLLQFQEGSALTAGQWSALDAALRAHCGSGSPVPPPPPPPLPAGPVTLSQGHASAVSPVRETVTWHQSAPSWDKLVITGPGAINGHTGCVHVTGISGEGFYGGLEPGHHYAVTIQPEVSCGGAVAGAQGHVYFLS